MPFFSPSIVATGLSIPPLSNDTAFMTAMFFGVFISLLVLGEVNFPIICVKRLVQSF